MPLYNLLECSKNYSKMSGSSWNFYKGESNNPPPNDPPTDPPTFDYNRDSITNSASFKYKSSITVKTLDDINVIKKLNLQYH